MNLNKIIIFSFFLQMGDAKSGEGEGAKNPPYLDMIVAAIKADNSRSGTSKPVR